jgi:hypothetical protein
VRGRHFLFVVVLMCLFIQCIIPLESQIGNPRLVRSEEDLNHSNDNRFQPAVSWLSGWDFRKSHTMIGSPGAATNYQVMVNVNRATGTDSGDTVYVGSKCKTDFSDIRFTASDGITLLSYWLASVSGSLATFWVKVADDLNFDQVIYIYYGNSGASSLSNGFTTFMFFDDFNDGAVDTSKWNVQLTHTGTGSQSYDETNGKLHIYSYSTSGYEGYSFFSKTNYTTRNFAIHIESNWNNLDYIRGGNGFNQGGYCSSTGKLNEFALSLYCDYNVYGYHYVDMVDDWNANLADLSSGTAQMDLSLSGTIYNDVISGTYSTTRAGTNSAFSGTFQVDLANILQFWTDGVSCDTYWDIVYMRKYVASEPQHGAWESEEEPVSISHPPDVHMNDTDVGRSITWVLSGFYPASYEVRRNGTLVISGPWNSTGELITVSLDGLSPAMYRYNATVTDTVPNTASDVVIVTVDKAPPVSISHPPDVQMNLTDTGWSITWVLSSLHPASYQVRRNGTLVISGPWNSTGEHITVSLDGLSLGVHVYNATITNTLGNTTSDVVIVTVQKPPPPSISHPPDVRITQTQTGWSIAWVLSSLYPASYQVRRNGTLVISGPWNSTGELIVVSLNGLSPGVYGYNATITDTVGDTASDVVIVTVQKPPPPSTDHPPNVQMTYETDTGRSITWVLSGPHPASYKITRNGMFLTSGRWSSNRQHLTVSLSGLSAGVYSYNITITDTAGNTASDLVIVTVGGALALLGENEVTIPIAIACVAVLAVFAGLRYRSRG